MTASLVAQVSQTLLIHKPLRHPAWTVEEMDRCASDILAVLEESVVQSHEGRNWLFDMMAKAGITP